MMNDPPSQLTDLLNRRAFLRGSGIGFGAAMLDTLLSERSHASLANDSLGAQPPHFVPRAKSVIYLHMVGAPSQLDLFEHKPELEKWDGELCPDRFIEGKRFAFLRGHPRLASSRYAFARHGQSGASLSELLPHLSQVADELCIVRSLHTDEINHAPAQLFLHTGFGRLGRPGFGSWVTYGLGTANRDLPAYIVLQSGRLAGAGANLWAAGFLPPLYQGVQFRSGEEPVFYLKNPAGLDKRDRRRVLDTIRRLNQQRLDVLGDPEIATRIAQYEMAFRMQTSIPELADVTTEGRRTLDLYGIQADKASFATNCLLARRLVERGVRVVELYDADWDHHSNLAQRLPAKCRQVDRAMAALITDLKQRGLLDDTLVIWGSEFGRTPMQQTDSGAGKKTKPGRDHHKEAFTVWLAGGGVKRGISFGATDEFGYSITENPVHVHDLNATVLHLLGLDHERLTHRFQGRDFRLTDVHGRVVKEIIA